MVVIRNCKNLFVKHGIGLLSLVNNFLFTTHYFAYFFYCIHYIILVLLLGAEEGERLSSNRNVPGLILGSSTEALTAPDVQAGLYHAWI